MIPPCVRPVWLSCLSAFESKALQLRKSVFKVTSKFLSSTKALEFQPTIKFSVRHGCTCHDILTLEQQKYLEYKLARLDEL